MKVWMKASDVQRKGYCQRWLRGCDHEGVETGWSCQWWGRNCLVSKSGVWKKNKSNSVNVVNAAMRLNQRRRSKLCLWCVNEQMKWKCRDLLEAVQTESSSLTYFMRLRDLKPPWTLKFGGKLPKRPAESSNSQIRIDWSAVNYTLTLKTCLHWELLDRLTIFHMLVVITLPSSRIIPDSNRNTLLIYVDAFFISGYDTLECFPAGVSRSTMPLTDLLWH